MPPYHEISNPKVSLTANAAREEVRTYLRCAIKVLQGDICPQGNVFLILSRRLHDFKYDVWGPYAHSLKEATAAAIEIQSGTDMRPELVVKEMISILQRLYRTGGYEYALDSLERVKIGIFLENWLHALEAEG